MEKKPKYVLGDESVAISHIQEQYLGENGNLVTENFMDYTCRKIKNSYATLQDFLTAWSSAEQKKVILDEIKNQGISFEELSKVVGKDLDPFDLILHVVFEQPPLTRRERVEKVRKRNYFSKYGEQAAEVLKSLLEKYAETGIDDWENFDILKVDPLKNYGTQVYIIKNIFGGREKYLAAVRELQNEIYVA